MMKSIRNSTSAVLPTLTLAIVLAAANQAHAQQTQGPRVWEVPFGTPASQMPVDFRLPACGTHGGPPGIQLKSFAEFTRCRAEPESGLREVWFSYDDDTEYYLRATRTDPAVVDRYRANQMFTHAVIYSLLFDAEGRLEGYRIATDPRESPAARADADTVGDGVRAMLPYGGAEWNCRELSPQQGQQPWGGVYENSICEKTANGVYVTIAQHYYLKAGQQNTDNGATPLASEFESSTLVEAINASLVRKVPAQ
jgi:hypothetical protein